VPKLIEALGNENAVVRNNAACALGEIGGAGAARPLFDRWKVEDDVKVACVISMSLEKLGRSAVPVLIEALGSENLTISTTAAQLLGRAGDPRAVDHLIPLLKRNDCIGLRDASAASLGRLGDPKAVGPLIEALADPLDCVRKNAAMSLGRIGDARAVSPLIGLLNDRYNAVVAAAIKALGKIGDPKAVHPLTGSLKDPIPEIRHEVAAALGKIDDERVLGPLIDRLQDDNSMVRYRSASALGKLGKNRAVEPLVLALKDPDYLVRYHSALSLGKLGAREAGPALVEALRHENDYTRRGAARALGEIGYREAAKPLRRLMEDDPKPVVRAWAAFAVYRLVKDEKAGKVLIGLVEKKKATEYQDIVRAFSLSGHPEAIDFCMENIRRSTAFGEDCAIALGRLGFSRAVPLLIEALKDEEWSRREGAIRALGDLGDPASVPPLIAALEDHEGSYADCETNADYAAEALKKLTGEDFGKDVSKWKAWLGKGK
jgi:HEAT repeat protein